MPLKRTPPPTTPKSPSSSNQYQSIQHQLPYSDSKNVNTQSRTLRNPCPSFSPGDEIRELKVEIKEMLNSWKVEQEANLNRVLAEQCVLMSKLTSDVTELKTQNLSLQKSNLEIEKSVEFMNQKFENMSIQIDNLQKEKKEYLHTINELQKQITDIKQCSRVSSIEIRNVPTPERESSSNLTKLVSNLGTILQTPIKGIRDIYRIPGKPGTCKPIVVEFTSVQEKELIIAASKSFNKTRSKEERLNTSLIGCQGKPQPFYVAEYLPSTTKKLFYLAREFAKLNKYEFCWSVGGKVFLRKEHGGKHVLVKSEQFLHELQRQP